MPSSLRFCYGLDFGYYFSDFCYLNLFFFLIFLLNNKIRKKKKRIQILFAFFFFYVFGNFLIFFYVFVIPRPPLPLCAQVFPRPCRLARHRLTHSLDLTYVCIVCERRYRTAAQLASHARRQHDPRNDGVPPPPPPRLYVCERCGKAFARIFDLRRHAKQHACEEGTKTRKKGRAAATTDEADVKEELDSDY